MPQPVAMTSAAATPPASEAQELVADDGEGSAGDWISLVALALAGLIPLGVIAMAIIWWRRRSRAAPVVQNEAPLTAGRIASEARNEGSVRHAPVFDREPTIPVETAPVVRKDRTEPEFASPPPVGAGVATMERPATLARKPITRETFAPRDGQVILPDDVPATYEERDRLMRGLVAQEPDASNPFRSPKARARRARLIIQSLGRKFENVTPRFDLSRYSYRWPHLAKPA